MQLAIELPDELGQELLKLKQADMQNFVQQAIKKMLLEEKSKLQAKQELFSLMSKVPSPVSLADELIQDRRLEARQEQQDNQ